MSHFDIKTNVKKSCFAPLCLLPLVRPLLQGTIQRAKLPWPLLTWVYECPKSNVSELHFESAFSGITELPSFGDVPGYRIKPFLPPKIGEFRNQGKGPYLRQIHLYIVCKSKRNILALYFLNSSFYELLYFSVFGKSIIVYTSTKHLNKILNYCFYAFPDA